jgi:ribose transport system substrate-binding protein
MNKTKLILFASIILGVSLFLACKDKGDGTGNAGSAGQKTVAVIPKGVSHSFWQSIKQGADAAGKDFNVKVIWKGPANETDIAGEVSIMEDMITQKVDGICLAPSHGDALVPVSKKAQEAGILLTVIDSGLNTEQYLSYVSTDNREGGRTAARRLGEKLNGKGKVAVLGVKKGSISTDEREDGFIEVMKEKFPGITVVLPIFYGESNAAKSLAACEDLLNAHGDLNGIFASNETSIIGAARAVRQRNLNGKVTLVGFDYTGDLGQNVREGVIDSLVLQDPYKMGYEGVKTIVDKLAGKTPERRIDTGVKLLTKDNQDTPEIQKLTK